MGTQAGGGGLYSEQVRRQNFDVSSHESHQLRLKNSYICNHFSKLYILSLPTPPHPNQPMAADSRLSHARPFFNAYYTSSAW